MLNQSQLIKTDIDSYLKNLESKSLLRFITCGSVDDGKSTLIGRLLYESKMIYEDQLDALVKDSKKVGTRGENIDFALLVDGLAAEREQGITIDVAYRYFSTDKRKFIVADTPGHEQYTRNMATGASTADLAILMIDARKGILTQTKRHSLIVQMLGVKKIVLAINKMDLVNYDEAVYNMICDEYYRYAKTMGIKEFVAIPVSAIHGDNIVSLSDRMSWYQGDSLIHFLESVSFEDSTFNKFTEFSMPVQWVNRPHLDFRGFSGQITSGVVSVGDSVKILPVGTQTKVSSIVTFDGELLLATEGQSVTLTFVDDVDVSRGDMIVSDGSLVQVSHCFESQLLWMSEESLIPGRSYWIKFRSNLVSATFGVPDYQIDINTAKSIDALSLSLNQIGVCKLEISQDIAFLPYDINSHLGSFIVIDRYTNNTVGMGLIQKSLDHRRWVDRYVENREKYRVTSLVSSQQRHYSYGHLPCFIVLTGSAKVRFSEYAKQLECFLFEKNINVYRYAFQYLNSTIEFNQSISQREVRQEMILKLSEIGYSFCDAGMVFITSISDLVFLEYDQLKTLLSPNRLILVDIGKQLDYGDVYCDDIGKFDSKTIDSLIAFTQVSN